MAAEIELTRPAQADLAEIEDWLVDRASTRTVARMMRRIRGQIDRLAEHPRIGPERPDLGEGRRIVIARPYVIIYRIHVSTAVEKVVILRIIHGVRDLPALLA